MFDTIKILPLYYHDDLDTCTSVVRSCYEAGIRAFEFTNRGHSARDNFKALAQLCNRDFPDLHLGIGTIYTKDDAQYFIDCGAKFIVQPVCTKEVAEACHDASIPWVPGAMTLNEIYLAHTMGAAVVKIFPVNVLGYDYIKSLRGPLPHVKLMVTGGVQASPDDVKAWLKAGANICGLGSQLFARNANDVTSVLREILQSI